MHHKKQATLLLLTLSIFCFGCTRQLSIPSVQKESLPTIVNNSYLAKDQSLFANTVSSNSLPKYTKDGVDYQLGTKDSLQLRDVFHCPTPTTSFWDATKTCQTDTSSPHPTEKFPLHGLKIALDPGHLAGTSEMAEIEEKLIKLKHPALNDSIFFYEGELTFLTVSYLKESLEQLGADVFVTRQSNESAFGYTYFEWLKTHFSQDLDSCLQYKVINGDEFKLLCQAKEENTLRSKKIIFHKLFKHLDFYQRAKIINQYNPHITTIIHFNVDVNNKGWNKPTSKNFNMAFVPGAFMRNETSKMIDFNHFVRLNHTNEINESIAFSNHILKGLKKHTNVDIINEYSDISYLNNYCIATNVPGVFARNLALTRQVKGIVCYVEALYQDNLDESLQLNKVKKITYAPDRIRNVSEGILEGIIEYIKYKKY